MKLKINSIDKTNERVWIQVLDDCDLSYYMLCDTTYYANHSISNELRHLYWFPRKYVKRDDWILLYSKNGTEKSVLNDKGTTTHIFFWDLDSKVWNNDGDAAVLLELNTWKTKRVS